MHQLETESNLPNISSYSAPHYATAAHGRALQRRALAADRHADVMFTFPAAQRSFMTRWAEPAY